MTCGRKDPIAATLGVCLSTVEKHISKAFMHPDEFWV